MSVNGVGYSESEPGDVIRCSAMCCRGDLIKHRRLRSRNEERASLVLKRVAYA